MNNTMQKKRNLVLPIAVGVVVLAASGFFASRAGLDKALVKQQVDAFITQAQEQAAKGGADLSIAYKELDVVGGLVSKHVVMREPVLTMKPLHRAAEPAKPGQIFADSLRVTTPSLEIYPESADLSALRIQLPEPVNLADEGAPEKSLLKITSNVPPMFYIAQKKSGEVMMRELEYRAPGQMDLTYLRETQAEGPEDKTPTLVPVYETLKVAVAEGSKVSSRMATDNSGLGNFEMDFRDIVITPSQAPTATLKAPAIKAKWSNELNEHKLNVVRATIDAGPITSDDAALPYQPVKLAFEGSYEAAMPKTAEAVASIKAQETRMLIKSLALSTKDASLTATANFVATASDALPVGTANIAVANLPYVLAELRKYQVLNERNEPIVAKLLQQITGKPLDQLGDVAIPIERVKDGAFKIGNSSFEELFAVLLGGAIKSPPVPQLPDPDKPQAEPIPVPDPSVRG